MARSCPRCLSFAFAGDPSAHELCDVLVVGGQSPEPMQGQGVVSWGSLYVAVRHPLAVVTILDTFSRRFEGTTGNVCFLKVAIYIRRPAPAGMRRIVVTVIWWPMTGPPWRPFVHYVGGESTAAMIEETVRCVCGGISPSAVVMSNLPIDMRRAPDDRSRCLFEGQFMAVAEAIGSELILVPGPDHNIWYRTREVPPDDDAEPCASGGATASRGPPPFFGIVPRLRILGRYVTLMVGWRGQVGHGVRRRETHRVRINRRFARNRRLGPQ